VEKLKRIGFFHFGENDKGNPISSLRKSLASLKAKSPELSDCLLVLPEAFNVRGGYFGDDHPDASIGSALKQISAETKIAFVAGLIEPGQGSTLGCNSAYLIDGACCHLLSRKRKYTRGPGAATLYRPCQFDDPVAHRGLRIVALVCRDADCDDHSRAKLLETVGTLPPTSDPIVLCVPACMTSLIPRLVVEHCWPQSELAAVVIANGDSRQSSVLRITSIEESDLWDTNDINIKAFTAGQVLH
jgi:hypothetical protein